MGLFSLSLFVSVPPDSMSAGFSSVHHIEVVSDMTPGTVLATFRTFTSRHQWYHIRRGCKKIVFFRSELNWDKSNPLA